MSASIQFVLDNQLITIDFNKQKNLSPTTTVLQYLRGLDNHKGVKEGCAEGDCGACTIVIAKPIKNKKLSYTAVDSCLFFLPMLHGKQLITVENLKDSSGKLHPVQQTMIQSAGSQCGFCTPGIVMSLFALYKSGNKGDRKKIAEALSGNLCRCTGYQSIIEAAKAACSKNGTDHFSTNQAKISKSLQQIKKETFQFISNDQVYHRPQSFADALVLRKKYPRATVMTGATDLALKITKLKQKLPVILDLSALDELKGIRKYSKFVRIGAGTPLQQIKTFSQKTLPALHEMLEYFGSLQIRNMATIGGNIGSASPVGDFTLLLSAYQASVILRSKRGERKVKIDDFIRGYRSTDIKTDELIFAVDIPFPDSEEQIQFYKISKRRDLDISTVSAGFRLKLRANDTIEDISLTFGGMAEMTRRASTIEKFLINRIWSKANIEEAMQLIDEEFNPIGDARAEACGRIIAAKNLLLKFWYESSVPA